MTIPMNFVAVLLVITAIGWFYMGWQVRGWFARRETHGLSREQREG